MFKTTMEGKETVSYGRNIWIAVILELSIAVVSVYIEDSSLLVSFKVYMVVR